MKLDVYAQGIHAGTVEHDREHRLWTFDYSPSWLQREDRYPLSPALTFTGRSSLSPEQHSSIVRTFFENLLPEGQALDDAARASKLSKAETFGLLAALGHETAGALEVADGTLAGNRDKKTLRALPLGELSERIRARPGQPFTVWDGRVRLSIAGYQDKLAVYEDDKRDWLLVDGSSIASTHIVKPEPIRTALAGMTSNERLCMHLASLIGLSTPATQLVHVPEPLLVIQRFDRRRTTDGVDRLHCIDGCQLLDLPVGMKYERQYGHGNDVKHIRDGANLPALFRMLAEHSPSPAADRLALLRWTIFQVLIGNTDAHAKNLSFFVRAAGIELAPAYDLVCGLEYADKNIEDQLAMAIGDEFSPRSLGAFDWAQFAHNCKLSPRLVARQLRDICSRAHEALPIAAARVIEEGGARDTVNAVTEIVKAQISMVKSLADKVIDVPASML